MPRLGFPVHYIQDEVACQIRIDALGPLKTQRNQKGQTYEEARRWYSAKDDPAELDPGNDSLALKAKASEWLMASHR